MAARSAATSIALLLALAFPRSSAAEVRRFAVLIGANEGDHGDVVLRYAESDARRVAQTLRGHGGFAPEDVTVLTDVSAEDVRRTLIGLNARLRGHAPDDEALLFVYYSGHGDAERLHLDGSFLSMRELRDLVAGSPATARVLVIDSCRSGTLTRVKGGRRGPSFAVAPVTEALGTTGLAILTSSAAGEDAQESDDVRASFFTHFLVSALLGAADSNLDHQVTLQEAWTYASRQTLAATAGTSAGPQHPTYQVELRGRVDLILTRPGEDRRRSGTLSFSFGGDHLIQRGSAAGPVVAEVISRGPGHAVALAAGRYHVVSRRSDHLLEGDLQLAAGQRLVVQPAALHRLEYARVVRRGGTQRTASWSVVLLGGVRSSILDLGLAPGGGLAARLDVPALALELRVAATHSVRENDFAVIESWELGAALAALRAFDLGHAVTLGLGLDLGLSNLRQSFDDGRTPARSTLSPRVGPLVQLEVALGSRLYGRAEVGVPTYLVSVRGARESANWQTPLALSVAAGLGWYL